MMDAKIETFESNLQKVKEGLAEKDSYIAKLEERLTELEKFYEQIANSQEEKFKALEKHMNVIEKAHEKSTRYQLKCSKSDFMGSSENGLKVHIAKKHTVRSENKSTACEMCNKSFKHTSRSLSWQGKVLGTRQMERHLDSGRPTTPIHPTI